MSYESETANELRPTRLVCQVARYVNSYLCGDVYRLSLHRIDEEPQQHNTWIYDEESTDDEHQLLVFQ